MYKTPSTREDNVEVTENAVILHGLNRFQPTETIPLAAISSVTLTQPPSWKVPPAFEIRTADGRVFERRAINGRKQIAQQFMDEAYTPILDAVNRRVA